MLAAHADVGGTLLMTLSIGRKNENADGYMTATWIWASSMYASASSGYTYGISGPIHYGLWGALTILFIYPFGKRIRAVALKAHTLAEVIDARHGKSSQLMLAGSNIVGSMVSITSNFIGGGALIALLSPFSFTQGILFIGGGMMVVMALCTGIVPFGGDTNNLIPQMAATCLIPVLLGIFLIMIVGALSSTADSDLWAMSSVMMADVYGQNIAKEGKANPKTMLFIGRITMTVATGAGLSFASGQLNILDLLVFVGALWGALVFPVIASFYWEKITNKAFTISVLVALACFIPVGFEWIAMGGLTGFVVDLLAIVGIGVVLGLMAFGFLGLKAAKIVGAVAMLAVAAFADRVLQDQAVLSGSLVACAVSTLVCYFMCFRNQMTFDFASIKDRIGDVDNREEANRGTPGTLLEKKA